MSMATLKFFHTAMIPESLIEDLKTGHQSIVDAVDRLQKVVRSYAQAKPLIREMREGLMAHFARQNDSLFDQLQVFYRSDREVIKTIEFLICDLKDIKIKYLVFFDRYSGEIADLGSNTFPVDFLAFARELMARIKAEEDYLLPLIAKIVS